MYTYIPSLLRVSFSTPIVFFVCCKFLFYQLWVQRYLPCFRMKLFFTFRQTNFLNLFFNCRKIALQCCVDFCHTMQINHNCIYIPSLLSLPRLPPSHPSRSSQSARLGSLCNTAISHQLSILHIYHMWYTYITIDIVSHISCLCSVVKSCPTLCNSMDCSLPACSVHGIFQARILKWVAISLSRGSSQPKDRIWVSWVSCIGRQIIYHWAT